MIISLFSTLICPVLIPNIDLENTLTIIMGYYSVVTVSIRRRMVGVLSRHIHAAMRDHSDVILTSINYHVHVSAMDEVTLDITQHYLKCNN